MRRRTSSAVAIAVLVAGCGASQPKLPAAQRVCSRAQAAGQRLLGSSATLRIENRDPADVECLISGRGLTADVEAQASPQAWTQYDTVVVHLAQANAGLPNRKSYMPLVVQGVGPQAIWVQSQAQLVATNGTQSRGGSYLTVTVSGHPSAGAPSRLALATALGHAALAVAPRGPSPGPAPS